MSMKIAIVGTRGIPNKYGGFEQFAQYLSVGLVDRGHSVTVYNTKFHPYNERSYKGVDIIRKHSLEKELGSFANFIYDFICLRDAVRRGVDVVLECGYQSSALSIWPYSKQTNIVTNMDGMEWRREKWNLGVKLFTRYFESLAMKKSRFVVADNLVIKKYLEGKYNINVFYIPYGTEILRNPDKAYLEVYGLSSHGYCLVIARIEPENNIDMILSGYANANAKEKLIIVGNHKTKYGMKMTNKYASHKNIRFIGHVYDKRVLDALRAYSKIYFHGHSVGGTNPSLLEAMGNGALIASHRNEFVQSILGNDGLYFGDSSEVTRIVKDYNSYSANRDVYANSNFEKIRHTYNWNNVINEYERVFQKCLSGEDT